MEKLANPSVKFFTIYPDAPAPKPASTTVRGSLPARSVHYCSPVTAEVLYGLIETNWFRAPPGRSRPVGSYRAGQRAVRRKPASQPDTDS